MSAAINKTKNSLDWNKYINLIAYAASNHVVLYDPQVGFTLYYFVWNELFNYFQDAENKFNFVGISTLRFRWTKGLSNTTRTKELSKYGKYVDGCTKTMTDKRSWKEPQLNQKLNQSIVKIYLLILSYIEPSPLSSLSKCNLTQPPWQLKKKYIFIFQEKRIIGTSDQGHGNYINCVQWVKNYTNEDHPISNFLLSTSSDGSAKIWSYEKHEKNQSAEECLAIDNSLKHFAELQGRNCFNKIVIYYKILIGDF